MLTVDVLVVGGGMVGAACALGLAKQGKSVALVEATEPKPFSIDQPMDLRISAISTASIKLLERLEGWQRVLNMRACPYDSLATWETEEGCLQFDATSLGLQELGFMVENRVLQLALWQELYAQENLTLFSSHFLSSFSLPPSASSTSKKSDTYAKASLNNGKEILAKLVIAADGANSWIRSQINIGITAWDYRHHCMLIHVKNYAGQSSTTWQHFTPNGPVAFLPFVKDDACLVWYADAARINDLKAMNTAELKEEILQAFPKRLGDIEVVKFDSFALTRRHAQQYYQGNVVLVGDAAHTINPLAGQGVNLGFKDVAALLTLLESAKIDEDLNLILNEYQCKRRCDNQLMQSAMDVFYKGFSNDITPIKYLRNVMLKTVQHSGPIKKQILKYAIGM